LSWGSSLKPGMELVREKKKRKRRRTKSRRGVKKQLPKRKKKKGKKKEGLVKLPLQPVKAVQNTEGSKGHGGGRSKKKKQTMAPGGEERGENARKPKKKALSKVLLGRESELWESERCMKGETAVTLSICQNEKRNWITDGQV